jgi:hypothetical protein
MQDGLNVLSTKHFYAFKNDSLQQEILDLRSDGIVKALTDKVKPKS